MIFRKRFDKVAAAYRVDDAYAVVTVAVLCLFPEPLGRSSIRQFAKDDVGF